MPVLINFKICDNAKECNGVAVCPTGALSWNDERQTIIINNSRCIGCGKCEDSCLVSAIRVAKDKKEHDRIKKEFEEDPRKISDLYVDRYGASPIHKAFTIGEEHFKREVEEFVRLVGVEFFSEETIECLLKSIPVSELFEGFDIKFRRVKITTKDLLKKFDIRKLPALLFFKKGKLLGKIEGYYEAEQKEELREKIRELLSRNK